jgi:para-nitrobenzyl esterase
MRSRHGTPRVKVEQGTLEGTVSSGAVSYKGIPYGASAGGPGRFRAPRLADGWTGVREARDFGPKAPQRPSFMGGGRRHPASEDCLTLNVWAPAGDMPEPLPVLVYVPGGGDVMDGPANRVYDGTRLARRGIVVVSVTYRLGALGFLRLGHLLGEDFAGSENNALRDIELALRWIRDNITAFGGDPDHITIVGESAGARNTLNSLAMPGVREIVSGAISESGGAITVMTPEQAEEVTSALLRHLSIRQADAARLLQLDAAQIVAAQAQLGVVRFPWRAVIDGTVLPASVTDAARAGALQHIALLVGTNANEYGIWALRNKSLTTSDPTTADTAHIRSPETLSRMLRSYEHLYPASVTDRQRRIDLMTAEEYWIPSVRMIEAQLAGGGQAWSYRFDWQPRLPSPVRLRAVHGMELPFVFGTFGSLMGRMLAPRVGQPERALSSDIQQAWVRFVTHGAPAEPARWPAYGEKRNVMIIDAQRWKVAQDPDGAERQLWDGVL